MIDNILPMLLKMRNEPFDDKNYIFELKLDGVRSLAFCGKQTILQSRNLNVLNKSYPELLSLHLQCKKNCILDGEIVSVNNSGIPDFQVLQHRFGSKGAKKSKNLVCFVAFDILFLNENDVTQKTLMERKKLLKENIIENQFLVLSRFVEEKGKALFEKVKLLDLEGIVAKRKDSTYQIGKRSDSWIKIKNVLEDDCIILGYLPDENGNVKNLILGKLVQGKFVFDGKVYLPNKFYQKFIKQYSKDHLAKNAYFDFNGAIWLDAKLVCQVNYAQKTKSGNRRQPVFKGIRKD